MKYQETDYEDELDRIRARHYRKKSEGAGGGRVLPVREDSVKNSRGTGQRSSLSTGQSNARSAGRTSPERNHRSAGGGTYHQSGKKRSKLAVIAVLIAALIAGAWLIKRVQHDDGYWTISVFGLDSRDGNTGKGALADVQLIASINKKTGEIRLASVFRDTYLQINSEGDYNKINEAYFLGGYEQAVTALQDNFDLQIDDCVTFNWKAVADAINVLGGIDLEITDQEFAYINSFITETVESTGVASTHLQQSGMNHLDGVQAVAYARLRLMDTDFKRTERQRKVIGLAMEKAKQANFKTLRALVGTVYPEIFTTISVDDILLLAKNAKKYYIGQTSGFPFSHTEMKISKKSCVVPATLESNVVQLHAFLYDDSDYQPSDLVKYISAQISDVSGIFEPGKDMESGKNIGAQDHIGGGQSVPAKTEAVNEEQPESAPDSSEEEIVREFPDGELTESESVDETLDDTNPENMEQGPGVSTPDLNPEPGSILDAFFGSDEDAGISPGEEPGTVNPEDALSGPGIEVNDPTAESTSPVVNAKDPNGNALEAPPGESKAPAETAETGLKPGETSENEIGPGAGIKNRRDADGPGWRN